MNLMTKLGIDRPDLKSLPSGESFVEKLFTAGSFAMSTEEYVALAEANDMIPDGSHLPEAERAAYIEEACKPGKKKMLDHTRILTFRGSDETKDGYGDIVRVDGWDLARYLQNPVFLAQHKQQDNPVARTLKVWKETADPQAPGGKSLVFRVYFPAGVSEETDAMFKLYEAGILNAVSVGFMPIQARSPSSDAERQALGLGPYGVEFLQQELLELSGVTIPANGNAVRVKSLSPELKAVCQKLNVPVEEEVTNEAIMAKLDLLSENLTSAVKALFVGLEELKSLKPTVEPAAPAPNAGSEPEGKSFFDLMTQAVTELSTTPR